MRQTFVILFLFFATCIPGHAFACSTVPLNADQTSAVAIGRVVSERYITSGPKEEFYRSRIVKLTRVEALKGTITFPVEVAISCGIGIPKVGERAIVVRDKEGFVGAEAAFPWLEKSIREELRHER